MRVESLKLRAGVENRELSGCGSQFSIPNSQFSILLRLFYSYLEIKSYFCTHKKEERYANLQKN